MNQEAYNIKSILFDVNVCIDLITNRLISPQLKRQLFTIILNQKIKMNIPAFSVDTIFYILNNSLKIDATRAKAAIQKLISNTKLLHTKDIIVSNAFISQFKDFEDAMINELAIYYNVDAIITSNIKDFKKSVLAIYSPADFVSFFNV